FPASIPSEQEEVDEEAALLRAADLIGQLGDPHYIRKANALYYEFEEAGLNRQLGYSSPADIVNLYPSSTGTASRRLCRPRSAISTSPLPDGRGSPISTAMCSAPNGIFRCRARRNNR